MTTSPLSRSAVHGAAGGFIAGAVVAAWFLVVDVLGGVPLETPARLASSLLGEGYAVPDARLVIIYSVLHFGVFALLGLAAGVFLAATGVAPGVLVGAVFGVGVLNGVYYGGRLVAGADLLNVLPALHVLGANLLGGVALMAWLHQALRSERPLGLAVLGEHPVLRDGLVTGLIGAGAVAVWFLLLDVIQGTPFLTPAALGSALLLGATGPADVQVHAAIIMAYAVVHVLAFWAVGVGVTLAVQRLERQPDLWLLMLMGVIVLEALFVGAAMAVSGWILGALSWWAVGVGNVVAVGSMGWWLARAHPELRTQLASGTVPTRV